MKQSRQVPDSKVKILMLGESGVGKSSILQRFTENKFTPNFYTTLGVEYKQKTIDIDKKTVQVQVWDTAGILLELLFSFLKGQERFKTITPIYYKSVDGVVLVYDITDRESFQNISYWLQNLNDHADFEKISTVLVGNKMDFANKVIDREEGIKLSEEKNMKFLESSAKTGENINEIFYELTKEIITKRVQSMIQIDEDSMVNHPNQNQKLDKQQQQKNKNCCQ